LKVFPADLKVKMPDGTTGYPESVLFRLIDSKGAPNVKIAATEDGSAMSLGGESNPTHVQVLARGTNTSLTLVNQDGRKQVIATWLDGGKGHRHSPLGLEFLSNCGFET